MPLYEYQCQACSRISEALQKMSDPPLTTCEVCGGTLKRLISAPAVQFKGTGWYVTDYARKGSSDSGKSGKSDRSEKPAADSGGDSKPAETATAASKPSSPAE